MEMLLTSNIHRSITNNAEESTATDNSHILYIQKNWWNFSFDPLKIIFCYRQLKKYMKTNFWWEISKLSGPYLFRKDDNTKTKKIILNTKIK